MFSADDPLQRVFIRNQETYNIYNTPKRFGMGIDKWTKQVKCAKLVILI
jgi:hypothetical protein